MVKIAPYGTWARRSARRTRPSPAAARLGRPARRARSGGPRPGPRRAAGRALRRDPEGTRTCCRASGTCATACTSTAAARTRCIADGQVVFTHWADQRMYLVDPDAARRRRSPASRRASTDWRYGDLTRGPGGPRSGACARPRPASAHRHRRDLVAVPLDGSATVRRWAAVHHFMTAPEAEPGRHGTRRGWAGTTRRCRGTARNCASPSSTEDGTFGKHRVIAGGPAEAVCQSSGTARTRCWR